jgi:hypothetical protein
VSNIVSFKSAGLPAVQELSTALRSIQTDMVGGVAILKMDRTGHWVFGADQTEVEVGSEWAVNPFSFTHGYIAWGEGSVLAEKMAPLTQPLPEVDDPPPGATKGWERQIGVSLVCVGGDDKGVNVRFSTTSVGGKKAVQQLAVAIAEQVEQDPAKPVPVVKLDKDHYQHKSYGKIYTPVFDIVEWVSMDGPPEAEEKPTTRRRRSA